MSVASEFSLPPNVSGRVKGHLELVIEKISWKTSKVFSDVKINVLWWGQREGAFCKGIVIKKSSQKSVEQEPLKTLRYQINTNHRLFQSYLANSDPLKISVYSTKTGDFVGSSKIEMSQKFLNSDEIMKVQSCKITSPILSSRDFILGELMVSLKMQPAESSSMSHNIPAKSPLKKMKSIVPTVLKEKNFNKENIQVIGNKKKISFRDPKPSKPSTLVKGPFKAKPRKLKPVHGDLRVEQGASTTTTASSASSDRNSSRKLSVDLASKTSLINYLSGRPMSRKDENNILEELAAISPSQSIIEALNVIETKPAKPNLVQKIDSMRITISQVEFNAAGQLETQNFMNKNRHQRCVLKCVVTSKIFKSNEDIKIISPVFETAPQSKSNFIAQ